MSAEMNTARPRIFGTPGGSLHRADWARNQRAADHGRRGEVATGAVLNKLAEPDDGPTVLHDLRIPIPGFDANIDHIVVGRKRVVVVDSKVWTPGTYWTVNGPTRRGLTEVNHVDSGFYRLACASIETFLGPVGGRVQTPLVVVWPSNHDRALRLIGVRPAQIARAVNGERWSKRPIFVPRGSADPAIVTRLRELVR